MKTSVMRRTRTIKPGRRENERGAVLVLTAIGMIAMLAFTALAVDIGISRSKRAQYQSVADSAALYATLLIRQTPTDPNGVSAAVKNFVAMNLSDVPATAAAWSNCTDRADASDGAPLPTQATTDAAINNDCITFDTTVAANAKARVRLPMFRTKPMFGYWVSSLNVTAVAGADGTRASTTTTTPMATTTTIPRVTTTTIPRVTTTTIPRVTTTTAPPVTTTTIPRVTTTTIPRVTTTTIPRVTTTTIPRVTTTTTTAPAPPTTIDLGA